MRNPQLNQIQEAVLSCSEKINRDKLSAEEHDSIFLEIEQLYNKFRSIKAQYINPTKVKQR